MSELTYTFRRLFHAHKDGSFNTRASRQKIGQLICSELGDSAYKLKSINGLKPKHIEFLVEKWKSEDKSAATIKNRMAILRWIARRIGKPNIIARSNDEYGIKKRRFRPEGKAKILDFKKVIQVQDRFVQFSLRLQETFGLRREESIKFIPTYAIKKHSIQLRGSWTKGGRARTVPITNAAQVQLLQELLASVPSGSSLIPIERNYKQQLGIYNRECIRVGLTKNHGLRHQYARQRYLALTGWSCPADGGPKRSDLEGEQKQRDIAAREEISLELGHGRFNVTYAYLGS